MPPDWGDQFPSVRILIFNKLGVESNWDPTAVCLGARLVLFFSLLFYLGIRGQNCTGLLGGGLYALSGTQGLAAELSLDNVSKLSPGHRKPGLGSAAACASAKEACALQAHGYWTPGDNCDARAQLSHPEEEPWG